ncbi:SDR family oxidoreductase [Clostridium sp. 'deep sea']|uniref:SDR family oxidoreductase n=1 Tax=Clostridium sp. 'deep sea' TaxID=2779445 RepID=UPI001A9B1B72|nr:SDR family oxidoreductase [Clostridium sp. 'deep sea']
MTKSSLAIMENQFATETPIRRVGKTSDVANLVTFLCKEESSFIAGAIFLLMEVIY